MMNTTPRNPLITAVAVLATIGLAIIGVIALSYIVILIAILGLATMTINAVRKRWMKSPAQSQSTTAPGRVIDHDDH